MFDAKKKNDWNQTYHQMIRKISLENTRNEKSAQPILCADK